MTLGAYMIVMIRICNYIFIHIKTKSRFMVTSLNWFNLPYWIFLHVAKIFFLNYICETVSVKSKMEGIIHQFTNLRQYADIRDEIYQFVLHMMYNPLRFTGLGFFYLGNCFLRKIVMTITTFVIIIMQMSSIPHKEYYGF
ncbi:uncharacterized protein LOC118644944 [Monomorium pharaonis]|uniref:uncharacterized protein LOC118644944 n=1 Tax=Monomorium pharaonis TaxID=307658 RepID=UPI0017471D07|nr:uncharacterized protein LOC118644944 [Monomorium pharaonis]